MHFLSFASLSVSLLALAACGGRDADAGAAKIAETACKAAPGGGVYVSDAWIRETSAPGATTAAYMTICNGGQTPVELIGASTSIANSTELHETLTNAEGVSAMRPVQSIRLEPGQAAELKPGGVHVMIFGLASPLAAGDQAPLTLSFADGPELEVSAKAMSRTDPAHDAHGHH